MPSKKTPEPQSSPGTSSPASSRSSSPAPTSSSKKRKPTTDPEDEIAVDLSAPEPPSKRARRALKKGKPLPKPVSKRKKDDRADLEADDDDIDDAGLPSQLRSSSSGAATAGKKERSNFGVWIGNLPFFATRADIFKWLVNNSGGSITEDAVTRVNLPLSKDKKPGSEKRDNKGFAYVDFATNEACIAAIALTESDYGGRRLLIKNAKSFDGRPAAPVAGAAGDDATAAKGAAATTTSSTNTKKIYVGNLPFDATEDTLRWQFEKCGTVEWAKVATFEDSGKCKGYGWVRFSDAAACDWAVKGFVKIKEAVETEEDFLSDDGAASDGGDGEDGRDDNDGEGQSKSSRRKPAAVGPEKTKTRKWWVNKLKGRPLTIQLAEDDQTRYKKRYGKDAPKRARSEATGSTAPPRTRAKPAGDEGVTSKAISYHTDINVARLTGAAVAPQGKKVTFD